MTVFRSAPFPLAPHRIGRGQALYEHVKDLAEQEGVTINEYAVATLATATDWPVKQYTTRDVPRLIDSLASSLGIDPDVARRVTIEDWQAVREQVEDHFAKRGTDAADRRTTRRRSR